MTTQKTLKQNLEVLQQKARERTVKTQNIEYDLDTLVKRIERGTIKLDPDYQRRHRWDVETSSRLIESLILNIPIPVIFISQDVDVDEEVTDSTARYTVIDGQQRLTAIYNFMNNNFSLEGLNALSELNGVLHRDLPPFLTRRLEERTIKCLRIDSTVDAQVKYDIFERLNTGSVKLEPQELRNATIRGKFNGLIKNLAKMPEFRALIQVKDADPSSASKVQKMEDVELVLRFFALKNSGYRFFKKGFKEFLTEKMKEFNGYDQKHLDRMAKEFETYVSFIVQTFGETAFAKWRIEGDVHKKMSNFNAAVFDAVAIGVSEVFDAREINQNPDRVRTKMTGYKTLFADKDFFAAVSGSVNDAAKITTRVTKMVRYLGQ